MVIDLSNFESRISEIKEWLAHEYSGLRTGRATPQILDSISVDVYGAKQPIKHSASISIEGPRSLKVAPWDKSLIPVIESAISSANLGISVSTDDSGVRVSFPELTEETRKNLVKIVKEKLEEARISVKKEREEVWSEIQKAEKDGDISEDDKFKQKDELQKKVDEVNKSLEDMAHNKEKELTEI